MINFYCIKLRTKLDIKSGTEFDIELDLNKFILCNFRKF